MLKEKVEKIIKTHNLIDEGEKVVVGVSGGPDSMCLLHILHTLKKDIVVCHINHMIRQNAIIDEQYVENYCKKQGIPVYIARIPVEQKAKQEKKGTEEAGREARYEFFYEIAEKVGATKIATAHNANDNAETVIMNIIRGTSINGLKGIEEKRGMLIRPLITITRDEIEEYCKEEKIEPRQDESNKELIYTRNKIRNELIPYIKKEINPNIIEAINRMSQIAKEETDYLQEEAKKAYQGICVEENQAEKKVVLNLKKFNELELVIKRRVILYTITKIIGEGTTIQKIHIEDIIKLCKNNIGGKYLTPTKNVKVEIKNKKIYVTKVKLP